MEAQVLFMGDGALLVRFEEEISPQVNDKVRALVFLLEGNPIEGVVELVPTYRSLMICFDPLKVHPQELSSAVRRLLGSLGSAKVPPPRVVEIPTLYGGKVGPDLPFVASHAGLSPEEVISLHSGTLYRVYMLGFAPGFSYLGGLDPRIHAPRLKTPRVRVPAGSVGIGGAQTGIYAVESPGGWRIIGRTPLKIYDPSREEPVLVRAGDLLRFVPISEEEFLRLGGSLEPSVEGVE